MFDTDAAELKAPIRNAVGSAYGQVLRQTDSARDMELRVFAEITAEMETVRQDMPPGERNRIVARNRELWSVLTWCAIDDNNALPVHLRANIIGIGKFVDRECSRIMRDNLPLAGLIEINKTMMRGLAQAPAGGA